MKSILTQIIFIVSLGGLAVFQTSCEAGDPPRTENCDEFFAIDPVEDVPLFFDYDSADTLRYVRIINDVVEDTLVFIIQERKKDNLKVNFQTVNDCIAEDKYYERWAYDYQEVNSDLTYRAEYVGRGVGSFGGSRYLVTTNDKIIYADFGTNSYGQIGYADYKDQFATSQGQFNKNWAWCFVYTFGKFSENGYGGTLDKTGVTSVYNIEHGRVQITFDHGNEVWDLIP